MRRIAFVGEVDIVRYLSDLHIIKYHNRCIPISPCPDSRPLLTYDVTESAPSEFRSSTLWHACRRVEMCLPFAGRIFCASKRVIPVFKIKCGSIGPNLYYLAYFFSTRVLQQDFTPQHSTALYAWPFHDEKSMAWSSSIYFAICVQLRFRVSNDNRATNFFPAARFSVQPDQWVGWVCRSFSITVIRFP